MRPNILS